MTSIRILSILVASLALACGQETDQPQSRTLPTYNPNGTGGGTGGGGGTTVSEGSLREVRASDGSSMYGISCWSATGCAATGTNAEGSPTVQITADGISWLPTAGAPSVTPTSVQCFDANTCYIGGRSASYLAKTIDGGATWANLSTAVKAANSKFNSVTSISCPDSNSCYAIHSNIVIKTDDGGDSWTDVSPTKPGGIWGTWEDLWCTSTSHCIIVGPSILVTTDGGQNWTVANTVDNRYKIMCNGNQTCWAAGKYDVFKSENAGASWDEQVAYYDGGDDVAIKDIWCMNAASQCWMPAAFRLIRTTREADLMKEEGSAGSTFYDEDDGIDTGFIAVQCVGSEVCYFVGNTIYAWGGN